MDIQEHGPSMERARDKTGPARNRPARRRPEDIPGYFELRTAGEDEQQPNYKEATITKKLEQLNE